MVALINVDAKILNKTLSQTESNGTFGCPERIDYDQM